MDDIRSVVVLSDEQLLHQFHCGNFGGVDVNGWNTLMHFLYKKETLLNEEQMFHLMQKTDLLHCDVEGNNALMIAFNYFKPLPSKLYDYLLANSDVNQLNTYSRINALMLGLIRTEASYNDFSLNLSHWDYLINNTDLKHTTIENNDAIQYAFRYNNSLSGLQRQKLIENCDLSLNSDGGLNALMYACIFNKRNKLYLSKEQWDYLIEKSNIFCCNPIGNYNALSLALKYNDIEELKLQKSHFLAIIDKMQLISKEGQQQLLIVLKSLCKEGVVLGSFKKLWDYFEDKNYLVNFIEKQDKDLVCFLQLPEILAFKEKKLLEKKTFDIFLNDNRTKINKL